MTKIVRLIVCGGRTFPSERVFEWLDRYLIKDLEQTFHDNVVIASLGEGGATGADHGADLWSQWFFGGKSHTHIQEKMRDANDGPARNMRLFKRVQPNVLVAFPGNHGTANMISIVEDWNKSSPDPIRIIYPKME